jgi:hypothetical protein
MEKTVYHKKVCIGKDKIDNSNVYLVLEIKEHTGIEKETIYHKKIMKYKTLSLSGYSKDCFGQIRNSIIGVVNLKCDESIIKEIICIWNEYHLNDLHAGCIHQKEFNCNINFEEQAKKETLKCPLHYNYGSKWLVKLVPQRIFDRIMILFNEVE